MPLRSLKQLLLAKTEVTYGLDPVPTGALNAILVSNVKLNPLSATEVERKALMSYIGNLGKIIADFHVQIDFDVEIAASGTLGTAPAWGVLMKGCALSETIVATTSVTYAPISTGDQSLTLYLNIDGKNRIITGAKGTFKTKLSPKGIPMLSFTFTGLYNAATDVVQTAGVYTAFKAPLPVNKLNTTMTIAGLSAPVSDFNFDIGNKIVYRNLINSEYVGFIDRATTGSVTVEENLVATKDWDAIVKNATLNALAFTHGTVAGQKVQINAPAVQLHGMQTSEADNYEMLQFNMAFIPVGGNDEFTIVCI